MTMTVTVTLTQQPTNLLPTPTTAPPLPSSTILPQDDPAVQSMVMEAFAVLAVSMMQQLWSTNRSMLNVYKTQDPSAGW